MKNYCNISTTNLMLNEIASTHSLKIKEERNLFDEYATASIRRKKEIKTKIVKSNMRFVLDVALKYKNVKGVSIPDLVSEGKLGLLTAFDRFDKNKKLRFISYAVWWIRVKMSKYLEENDLIRLPTHRKVKLNKERKNKSVNEFDKDTYYLHELTTNHLSLDDNVGKENDVPISEIIKDEKAKDAGKTYENDKFKSIFMEFLSNALSSEEYAVINSLYGIEDGHPMALRDVKDVIGKSHERVRQIRDKALRILRKSYNIDDFKSVFYGMQYE